MSSRPNQRKETKGEKEKETKQPKCDHPYFGNLICIGPETKYYKG